MTFSQVSPYVQVETTPVEKLRVTAGLRFDCAGISTTRTTWRTASSTPRHGPTSPVRGLPRPEDQNVDYDRLSPSLGATYAFTPTFNGFVAYKESFRVPQEGQLFRPGANLDSTNLKPVKADSYEIGLRARRRPPCPGSCRPTP